MSTPDRSAPAVPPLPAEDHRCPRCRLSYPSLTVEDALALVEGLPAQVRATVQAVPPGHLRRRPEPFGRYVIAHELAHVLQVSRGQQLRPQPHWLGETVAYALSPVEREADEIALRWGFDGSGLNRWLERNVRWHALPADPY